MAWDALYSLGMSPRVRSPAAKEAYQVYQACHATSWPTCLLCIACKGCQKGTSLVDHERGDHAEVDVRLAGGGVPHVAEGDVLAWLQVQQHPACRPWRDRLQPAGRCVGRRTGRRRGRWCRVHPGDHVLHGLAGGNLDDDWLVGLAALVDNLERGLARGHAVSRHGEGEVAQVEGALRGQLPAHHRG